MIRIKNIDYNGVEDLIALKSQIGDYVPYKSLIQIFSGKLEEDAIKVICRDIEEVFPDTPYIGTTTSGEISNGSVIEHSVQMSFMSLDNTETSSVFINRNDSMATVAEDIYQLLDGKNPRVLILFGTGLKDKRTIDASPMLTKLKELLPETLIAGAQAGDNGEGIITRVFSNKGITTHGVVAAVLKGETLIANNSYNLAWIPIGKTLTITKSDGPRVYSINDRSPYDLYCHYLGQDVADGLPLSAANFPLIIERDGIAMAIHAIGVNDDGSFEYIHSFKAGEQLKFGYCHAGLLAQGAHDTFEFLSTKPVEAVFIYSCVSRKWILGTDVEVELKPINGIAPNCGFFAYGEYYSHPLGKNLFFSQTMTVLTLSEGEFSDKTNPKLDKAVDDIPEETWQLRTLRVLHRLVETSAREIESINSELVQLVQKDSLTGIYNRRYFDEHLEKEFKRSIRTINPLSLLMIDIDHFKLYNDTYGHVKGDICIRGVALTIKEVLHRSMDITARYGGEEFSCILPETDFEGAMKKAQEIRRRIEQLDFEHIKSTVSNTVTVSIGVYTSNCSQNNIPPKKLVECVDKQLYKAKAEGRNRVVGMKEAPLS